MFAGPGCVIVNSPVIVPSVTVTLAVRLVKALGAVNAACCGPVNTPDVPNVSHAESEL